MSLTIANGVILQSVYTEKFKNNKIIINFNSPVNSKNYAKLALLAELLENGSSVYNSELAVSRKLAKMYGASFGVSVLRYGNQHTLQVQITFPNEKYLPNKLNLLSEISDFLREIIENPLVNDGQFIENYFLLHRNNLANYLNSISENKEYYAELRLQEQYYPGDPDHGAFLLGDAHEVQAIQPRDLFGFYNHFLTSAQITIMVVGNILDKNIIAQFKSFKTMTDRVIANNSVRVIPQAIKQPSFTSEPLSGGQSMLDVGYYLATYFGDDDYFTSVVFNQVFGGSTQSLLFTEVREKASLAYDIHSNYNSLTGMLTVAAGINVSSEERVIKMIDEQLQGIIDEKYSDQLLSGIKHSLINQRRSEADYESALVEKKFIQQILNSNQSDEEWEKGIIDVTKEDVGKIARKVVKRATFMLRGGHDRNEDH